MDVPRVDFLPPEYHALRRRRRLLATRGGVAVVLLLGMVVASFAAAARERALERELDQILSKYELARDRIRQMQELDNKRNELSRRMDVLSDVLRRTRASVMLDAVAKASPPSVCLTKVECHQRDNAASPEIEITIEGRCLENEDVSKLVKALSANPLMSDVAPIFTEDEDATRTAKKFLVSARAPGLVALGAAPAAGGDK